MTRIVLLAALAAAPLMANQAAFKAAVDLVSVPVAVIDADRRRHVEGLTAQDFRVFEDGVAQEISVLDRERRAVSLCIAVDASGSMGEGVKQLLAVRAMRETVAQLDPDDQFAVVTFAKTTGIAVPWTAARESSKASFDLNAEGETSLNDGLKLALDVLEQSRHPKRAILLVTDGFENASRTSLKDAITTRRQSETLVYAFGLSAPIERRPDAPLAGQVPPPLPMNVDVLPALVGDSGGVLFRVGRAQDASSAARALIDDLKYQYTLGYTPAKPFDGKYRRIDVEVAGRSVTVRHRAGYIAAP